MPSALLADIGGTNTRVALADDGDLIEGSVRRYVNAEFVGLEAVLSAYQNDIEVAEVERVCVDIAGPVEHGRGTLTNLDWTLDETHLQQVTKAKHAALINDLQAQAYGIEKLSADNILTIGGAPPKRGGTALVVNVGTGFNAVPILNVHGESFVPPSEAGHASMPVRSADDLALSQHVGDIFGFPSIEEVLSGRGLKGIHDWLAQGRNGIPLDRSPADIMELGLLGSCPVAEGALRKFARIFGSVSGNLALVHLPVAGVFLVGGVVQAIANHLEHFGFMDAFCDKGRFGDLMRTYSVHVVQDDYAALRGAAVYIARQA